MFIMNIVRKNRMRKKLKRIQRSREILKEEIKPYDWTKFYE